MEWYIMNSSGVRSLASGLGELLADESYKIHDECSETLEELLEKISHDDPVESITKQHLLAEQIIAKDLKPIIKHASPDVCELQLVYELLGEMCEPISADVRNYMKQKALADVEKLSLEVFSLFQDSEFVERLFAHMFELIDEAGELEMSSDAYLALQSLLKLVRNALYLVNHHQNKTVSLLVKRNLLELNLTGILVFAINCHARVPQALHVAQILSLLYRDFKWSMSEEDGDCISDKLHCLVVQLLQGLLATLIVSLKRHELSLNIRSTDSDYLPWLLAYFLPFLSHIPVSVQKLRKIFSSKLVGYLVYQASMLSMDIFGSLSVMHSNRNLNSSVCLVFSALDNIISQATCYNLGTLESDDCQIVMQLLADLVQMRDLWQLLLLYIRCVDFINFSRSFLCQLVCLNHQLLVAVEFYNQMSNQTVPNLLEHIRQFASPQVLSQYTLLVDSYDLNTEQTNMAVFTMLCHICVDCHLMDSLYTPALLKSLNKVCKSASATEEDLKLANLIIESFLHDLSLRPEACVGAFINSQQEKDQPSMDTSAPNTRSDQNKPVDPWTDEEESELVSAFVAWQKSGDVIKQVVNHLMEIGFCRTRDEVLNKLKVMGLVVAEESKLESPDMVPSLREEMCRNGNEDILHWIHDMLLTASYIKAMPKDSCSRNTPLCHFSIMKSQNCPLLPYSERQETLLRQDGCTRKLVECLGLYDKHMPDQAFIPCVASSMTAGQLYKLAEKLFPVGELPFQKISNQSGSSCSSEGEDMCCDFMIKPPKTTSSYTSPTQRSTNGLKNIWLMYMSKNRIS